MITQLKRFWRGGYNFKIRTIVLSYPVILSRSPIFSYFTNIALFFFSVLQILCISVGSVVIALCYVITSTVSCLSIVVPCKVTVI